MCKIICKLQLISLTTLNFRAYNFVKKKKKSYLHATKLSKKLSTKFESIIFIQIYVL